MKGTNEDITHRSDAKLLEGEIAKISPEAGEIHREDNYSSDVIKLVEQFVRASEDSVEVESDKNARSKVEDADLDSDLTTLGGIDQTVFSEYIESQIFEISSFGLGVTDYPHGNTSNISLQESFNNYSGAFENFAQSITIQKDTNNVGNLISQFQQAVAYEFEATDGNDVFVGDIYSDTVIYDGDTVNTDTDFIDLGSGNDVISSSVDFRFVNASIVNLGSGNDVINAQDIGFLDTAYMNMGAGDDTFNGDGIWIYGNSFVNTGSGNDTINGYVDVYDDGYLDMGDGDDIIDGALWAGSATNVYMGAGNDRIIIQGTTETLGLYNGSDIYMGDGDDYLDSGASAPYIQGTIDMGNGNDTVTGEYFYFSGIASAYLDMGAGNDIVNIGVQGAYNFDSGKIRLGAGNDTMYVKGTGEIEEIWGGSGSDTVIFSHIGGDSTMNDFSSVEGDVLDISQILVGYDPVFDVISDFARFVDSGADTVLEIDADGGADSFIALVTIVGGAGLDAAALEASGHLDTVV